MPDEFYFFGLEGPLDAVPARGQMRAANFHGFADLARRMGGRPRRILERHGIDPIAITDPDTHVPCQALVDALEYCAEEFDEPLFGLRLGLLQEPDVFGCVTALCRAAPDVRSAIESLVAFLPLVHSPEADVSLDEGPGVSTLTLGTNSDFGANEQAQYQSLMLNLKLLRTICGRGFQPEFAMLPFAARTVDVPEIERLLGSPIRLNAAQAGIVFASRYLSEPVASADRLLFRLLGGYLGRLRLINRESTVARVESYIRGALPSGTCSVGRCAEKLGISVRTLQVRLAARDLSFSVLLDREREKFARIYLAQTPMPLDQVAERLGYAEQTSFGRAFKRWTGKTPKRSRKGE